MNIESEMIHVEVVYALPHEQRVITLVVNDAMTVEEIIQQSGILQAFPDIDLTKNKVGIFSRSVKLDATVRDHDRIEIYRPLLADPKEIRRKRVEEARAEQKQAKK
ncbi:MULTISPECIES: RnfH family protein [Vibrio]|uniref:RnfH family protein n=1 Tax=Vibrio TaxID=662 RepID=UPI000C16E1A8|nr:MULTISPECIES: RnfH family protein [Vibrio]NAW68420.1 RnfH family protein [Vibrio sp. V28_P6S34P95]NAX05526.1 RnfH family protein [Vibrio sp. V30_P3S12P165]NAX35298.1 RnfH family protein [Vibrio sp. V29_P1S30P107]NAX36037.1 RnfH family protein [Vibrio sp. V27_P1S3P104]NAX39201.1 RnfH family protein [Vibrio sp. V26_P1S5P106]